MNSDLPWTLAVPLLSRRLVGEVTIHLGPASHAPVMGHHHLDVRFGWILHAIQFPPVSQAGRTARLDTPALLGQVVVNRAASRDVVQEMAGDEELDARIGVGRLAPFGMPADFDNMAPQLARLGGKIDLLDATG
jgi:hypothetical protein